MNRLAMCIFMAAAPLAAGRIDVSDYTFAEVRHGDTMIADFGIWNYGVNNPGYSAYPTGFCLRIITQAPGEETAALPGSTAEYFAGYAFRGWAESLDGEVSTPLYDPRAASLGFETGTLLLTPGILNGTRAAGVVSGSASMTSRIAEELFGSRFSARIFLENLGPDVTLGIGRGNVVRNAVLVPGVAVLGPRRVAGVVQTVTVANPEPATWALAAGAAVLLLIAPLRSRSRVCSALNTPARPARRRPS
jgi:hypothetical protein